MLIGISNKAKNVFIDSEKKAESENNWRNPRITIPTKKYPCCKNEKKAKGRVFENNFFINFALLNTWTFNSFFMTAITNKKDNMCAIKNANAIRIKFFIQIIVKIVINGSNEVIK